MKFCLIGPVWPYRGGISHNSAIVVNALARAGHAVQLISFHRQYPQWLYPGRTDRDNSQNPLKAEAEFILDPFLPWTWNEAIDQALLFKPDLVMIQWWTFFWAIPFAWISRTIARRGVKVAYLIHNVTPHEAHPLARILTRLALAPAQDYVVFSEFEEQKLHALLPGKRVILTHLPVYSFAQAGDISKEEARRALNLPIDRPILLFFGFVRPYKGLDILLNTLASLKAQGITPYLAIVGEFWKDKTDYIKIIERAGLGDQVRIEDRYVPNEEADLWFRGADLLVAPYTHGVTQSAVAPMAAGYGMPMIVTTHVAEGLEPVTHQSIQVVPPDDIEALEFEITKFVRNYSKVENTPDSVVNAELDLIQAIYKLTG